VKRQNSITPSDFTNFLEAGALLRSGRDWILAYGPAQLISLHKLSLKNEEFSVFCPDFYDVEEGKAHLFQNEARLSREEMIQLCRSYLENSSSVPISWADITWQEPDQSDFAQAFSHTRQLISQGQIDKAVPFVLTQATGLMTPATLVKCFLEMMDLPELLHVYGFWQDGQGMIGATPEVLFEKQGKKVSTMALAGTMAKSTHSRGDLLLKDKKEMHENKLVVDDIRQQLTPLGRVVISEPSILELPSLWHLITPIELRLDEEVQAIELVKRLHPTPALGVAPRRFGWRWMREWPQQKLRSRFGAPFLMKVDTDHWICLVAIRNLQWDRTQMMIGSGCGVVRDSELEREWLELFYKRESVKKILGIKS
jgi:isochorismate synthase EntC